MSHVTKNKTKLLIIVFFGILGLSYLFFFGGIDLIFEKVFMGEMDYNVYTSLGITLSGWKDKKNTITAISAGGESKDINQCKLGFVWRGKKYKICELTINDMQEIGLIYTSNISPYLTYSYSNSYFRMAATFLDDKIYQFSFGCVSYSNISYHFYIHSENDMITYFIMPITRTDMIRKLGKPDFNYCIPML